MNRTRLRKGQRYRTREDVPVKFLTYWRAPFTGGGKGTIPAGTLFTIARDPVWWARIAEIDPEERDRVEKALIPEDERNDHKYSGFRVFIRLGVIRKRCDLLSP